MELHAILGGPLPGSLVRVGGRGCDAMEAIRFLGPGPLYITSRGTSLGSSFWESYKARLSFMANICASHTRLAAATYGHGRQIRGFVAQHLNDLREGDKVLSRHVTVWLSPLRSEGSYSAPYIT
jgi:hypothetical protein